MVNVLGTLTCPKNEERWDGNSIGSGVRIQSCTNRQLRTFGKDIWLSINSCQVLSSILQPYTYAWLISSVEVSIVPGPVRCSIRE